MYRCYFIKHNQNVKRLLGCDRATLIFDRLEFYSSKKPQGFYKFLEPNSHKLYKNGDSWTELLGCHRTSFWRAFKLIGKKHISKWEFEKAVDKFEGKLYASYYDRLTNRMFFVRNNEAVETFLARVQLEPKSTNHSLEQKTTFASSNLASNIALLVDHSSVPTEQNARSHKEAKNTSVDLSKDKSHAGNDTIKKMVDTWISIVGEGREQFIEIKGKVVSFLKQALKDKFDNCLQKWKEYCISIARSKFLMGEKTSFKATLDWALKFDVIAKILSGGCYGIGDRSRKLSAAECEELEKERQGKEKAKELDQQKSAQALEEEIKNRLEEQEPIRNFRIKWLRTFGEQSYREFLANSTLTTGSDATELIIQPQERMTAVRLVSQWKPEILSGQPLRRVQVYHCIPDFRGKPLIFDCWLRDGFPRTGQEGKGDRNVAKPNHVGEKTDVLVSPGTSDLRKKLKDIIPPSLYPAWLDGIEVQGVEKEGTGIIVFGDQFTADYARSRFYQEILLAGKELWGSEQVIIQGKGEGCLKDEALVSKDRDEGLSILQAIKSLVTLKPAFQLNDEIPF